MTDWRSSAYIITGLGSILTCLDPDIVHELGGAGLAGFFAMFPWAVMGWIKRENN